MICEPCQPTAKQLAESLGDNIAPVSSPSEVLCSEGLDPMIPMVFLLACMKPARGKFLP